MIQLACMFDGGLCILAYLGIGGLVAAITNKLCTKKDCDNHDHQH